MIAQNADILKQASVVIFLVPLVLLNVYSVARFVNILRAAWSTNFFTEKRHEVGSIEPGEEPHVTIQICSYNEGGVVEATIDAACGVAWPRDKLCVQVLDDSTEEESSAIARRRVDRWRRDGVNCQYLTRPDRVGYKAGNLSHHMPGVHGPFVAIMDSDHKCEPDFLLKTVPHFYDKSGNHKYDVGLVQTPWSFCNVHDNLLSECDALNSDIHHVIEQQGRSNCLSCFSFNGTGGVWRKDAIVAGKGFSWDTVTEDLDLSYTSHLAGYRLVYVPDAPQLLESPSNILAYRQQKHRWNKGYFQVYRKSMQVILECDHLPLSVRIESFLHITSPITCCFGLMLLLMTPVMMYIHNTMPIPLILLSLVPALVFTLAGIIACYAKTPASNRAYSTFWERTKRLLYIPCILCLAMGTCIFDTRAVVQGMVSDDATFLRTPKVGDSAKADDKGLDAFDLFENQDLEDDVEAAKEATETGGLGKMKEKEAKEVLFDTIFVLLGMFVGLYLLILPCVDIFIWSHGYDMAESRLYEHLLSFCLFIPASALFAYHGKIYLEMDKGLLLSAFRAPANDKEQMITVHRGRLRRLVQCIMLTQVYTIGRVIWEYTPTVTYKRAERRYGHTIMPRTRNATVSEGSRKDMQLPRILLAGVQKSGSTAVADFVHRAGVCLSRPDSSQEKEKKEVHFFDRDETYEQGVQYYSDLFTHCENTALITDATPETFLVPRRVRETYDSVSPEQLQELRIVMVVREPVARELSWYNHQAAHCYRNDDHCRKNMVRNQIVNGTSDVRAFSFTEYAEDRYGELMQGKHIPSRVTRRSDSFYGDHFENWAEYFDRKQILVLSYSELKQNESSFLQRLVSFLDLDVDPSLMQAGTEEMNTKAKGSHKVKFPACGIQDRLHNAFTPSNEKFFRLLEQDEGPEMEQQPFPHFELSNCTVEESIPPSLTGEMRDIFLLSPASKDMFISFDLGGSGLKAMHLGVSDFLSHGGVRTKQVNPIGDEVNLGRIPRNTSNPKEWLKQSVQNELSLKLAEGDFGFSGHKNTFKLFDPYEIDAIKMLVEAGNLESACKDISSEVPSWAQGVNVWCKEWFPADQVLGLSDDDAGFRGSFNDGRAHFEGARARLELMELPVSTEEKAFVFVSWGLGTGQTIFWTSYRDRHGDYVPFHPKRYQTASEAPHVLDSKQVAPVLSSETVYQPHEILVDIPESVKSKNIALALDGWEQPLDDKPLPFWMIFSGYAWLNPSLPQENIREIYRSFFEHQVIGAIQRGDLPKPSAMVFSGGQEEHFHIAEMLRDILEEEGIKSVAGLEGGSHCGVARLSYPDTHVVCQFDDLDVNPTSIVASSTSRWTDGS